MGKNEIKMGCWVAVEIDWLGKAQKRRKVLNLRDFSFLFPFLCSEPVKATMRQLQETIMSFTCTMAVKRVANMVCKEILITVESFENDKGIPPLI
jgi:hypothetical protein